MYNILTHGDNKMSRFKKRLIISNIVLIVIYILSKIIFNSIPQTPDIGLAGIFTWEFVTTMLAGIIILFSRHFAIVDAMLIIILTIYELIPKKNINLIAKVFAIAGLILLLIPLLLLLSK